MVVKKVGLKKATQKKSREKTEASHSAKKRREVLNEINDLKEKLRARRIHGNEEKKKIAQDMLERYTGMDLKDFKKQIILTNFHYYVERFNALLPDAHYTQGSAFKASSSKKAQVTIIEFGVGAAMAALIGELLAVCEPKAVLFLGLAGGVHPSLDVGDFVLPIASIKNLFLIFLLNMDLNIVQEQFIPQIIASGNLMIVSN